MSRLEYSKKEIDLIVDNIKQHLDSNNALQNEKLDRILEQTTKHNGRMSKIEIEVAKNEDEILKIKTSHAIANWAFGLTVPLIISMGVWVFFNQIQTTNETIKNHIQSDVNKWDIVFDKLGL